jgi:hypothetical protein
MRLRALAAALLAALAPLGLPAPRAVGQGDAQPPGAPAPRAAQDAAAARRSEADSIRPWVRILEEDPSGVQVRLARTIRRGPRMVAADERVTGDVVTFRGDVDVHGLVDGNAVALGGDVIVHQGGEITGSAIAVGGEVRNAGGVIRGDSVTIRRSPEEELSPAERMRHALSLATGWFLVLLVVGVAVIFLARRNLERIADAIEVGFGRAFLWGLVGQLAIFPVMLLGIVALAITILGILLIPFAIVAYFTAVAGAIALGFLAMAFVAGESLGRRLGAESLGRSGIALLLIGLLVFYGLWLLPGVTMGAGLLGVILRVAAIAVTWVAMTVGFGAAILTRGGTRDLVAPPPPTPPVEEDELSWQTPTPVSGVVAARRPTPVHPRARDLS